MFYEISKFFTYGYQISSQSGDKCLTYSIAMNFRMAAAAMFENGAERPVWHFLVSACFS
jgi:hypothetical protein